MTAAQLSIRRHDLRIRSVGRPGSAEAVRVAVAERLSEAEPLAGSGYWVLRSLDLRAVVGSEWTAAMIADSIARQLSGRMTARVQRGVDPDAAVWFPDRAAFLCAFLIDLAAGRTRGRWEYGQFAPLLSDPASALARLAADEPEATLTALVRLSDRELDGVIGGIGTPWIDAVISALSTSGSDPSPRDVIDIVTARASWPRTGARGGLLVAIIAARHGGSGRLAAVASSAVPVLAVVDAAERAGAQRGALLAAISAGDWARLRALVGAQAFDPMLGLVAWHADDREWLAAALDPPPQPAAEADVSAYTPFGGMFLLLPLLDDLWDWRDATRGWPSGGGVCASTVVRLRVIAAALVGGRPHRIVHDAMLRRALAIAPPVGDDVLEGLARALTDDQLRGFEAVAGSALPEQADPATGVDSSDPLDALVGRVATALMRALGARLPGQAAASIDHLRREALEIDASVRFGGDARAVVVLSHPPLGVVVSLSGLNRGDFRMPESEELTWTLTTRG